MVTWKNVRTMKQLRQRYEALIQQLREIARKHGYGLGVHGSLERDLDLIAIPWAKRVHKPESMVMEMHSALCGYPDRRKYWHWDGRRAKKPHGRLAYSIVIARMPNYTGKKHKDGRKVDYAYIDLSVMPKP